MLSSSSASFLDHPGRPGAFGALMDEYARAAAELCVVVEGVPAEVFERAVEGADPETASIRAVCGHVVTSAYGYANRIRRVRDLARIPPDGLEVEDPAALRGLLAGALRGMEGAVAGLVASEEVLAPLRFEVPWGPTYDPEMLLEHAIVHLLRHRRQIERWPR